MEYLESLDALADGEDVFGANSELSWTGRYPTSVRDAIAMGGGVWPLAVSRAISAGLRDVNELTNLAFWMHVPELGGKEIPTGHSSFNDWAELWKFLRTGVRGIVESSLPPASNTPSGNSKPSSDSCRVVGQTVICGICRADGSSRPPVKDGTGAARASVQEDTKAATTS